MPISTASPGGLVAWLQAYGNVVGFFVQMAFYVAVAAAAIYAVLLLRRYVNHVTGYVKPEPADDDVISIEEFVE